MVKQLPNSLSCPTCKSVTFTNLNDYNEHLPICPGLVKKTSPLNTPVVMSNETTTSSSPTKTENVTTNVVTTSEIDSGNMGDDDASTSSDYESGDDNKDEEKDAEEQEHWNYNMYSYFRNGRTRTTESKFREEKVVQFFWGKIPDDQNMFHADKIYDFVVTPKSYHSKIKNHVKHFLTSYDGKTSNCITERATLHWLLITMFLHLPYYLFKKSLEGEYLYSFLDSETIDYFNKRSDFINSGLKDELVLKAKLYDLTYFKPQAYLRLLRALSDVCFQKALKVTYMEHIHAFKKMVNNYAIKDWNDYCRDLNNFVLSKTNNLTNFSYFSPIPMVIHANQMENPQNVQLQQPQQQQQPPPPQLDFQDIVADLIDNNINDVVNTTIIPPTTSTVVVAQSSSESSCLPTANLSTTTTPVVIPNVKNDKKRVKTNSTTSKESKRRKMSKEPSKKVDFNLSAGNDVKAKPSKRKSVKPMKTVSINK